MKIKYLLVAATVFTATPAMAQTFTGPRVEAQIGYQDTQFDGSVDGEEAEGQDSLKSVPYGGEVGFDIQMGNSFVVGGYAGLLFGGDKVCDELFGNDEICAGSGRTFTIGGRAGVPIRKNGLIYGKLGYTNTRLKATYEDFDEILESVSESGSMDGFHLGAGFELAAGTSGVYVKGEYTYTMYNGANSAVDDVDFDADAHRHQALIGVGFRF
jgi:outer membrane immunogenic protein